MLPVSSLLVGAAAVAAWAAIRFGMIPRLSRRRASVEKGSSGKRGLTKVLKLRMVVVASLTWVWILALVLMTGGLTVQRNQYVLLAMVIATVTGVVLALSSSRRN